MRCSQCAHFVLSSGALYVGDCKADINTITTINSNADYCRNFDKKEKEDGMSGNKKEN